MDTHIRPVNPALDHGALHPVARTDATATVTPRQDRGAFTPPFRAERAGFKSGVNTKVLVLLILVSMFFSGLPQEAEAAIMSINPESGIYTVGKTFSASIRLNTEGQATNAAQGEIDFSRDVEKLEVVSLSRSGSVFSLWAVEPQFNNQTGKIEFAGGAPTPGFVGSSGTVLTITFRPKTAGSALVLFSRGAALLNDGKGTNALSRLSGANYTFEPASFVPREEPAERPTKVEVGPPSPPKVESPTHPKEDVWYPDREVEFRWPLPQDIIGVSFAFNQKRLVDPGPVSDGLFDHKIFENIPDGIWYFHVKYRNERGWSGVAHRRAQVDGTPPSNPEVVNITKDPTDPMPRLEITARDELSGIAGISIKIGEGDFFEIGPPERETLIYALPLQYIGTRPVIVRAYDRAGNTSESTITVTVVGIDPPIIKEFPRTVDTLTDIVVKGESRPAYRVLAHLTSVKDPQAFINREAVVRDDGNWEVNFGKLLPSGRYVLSAEAVDSRGAYSPRTVGGEIRVESAVVKIGKFVITYAAIILLFLLIIALLTAIITWLWLKLKMLRYRVRRETHEAEETLHKGFDILIQNIRIKIRELEEKSTSRALTEEEERLKRTLETSLRMIEKHVEKEIRDIEEKL